MNKVDSGGKPVPNLETMSYNYIMQDAQRHLHMGESVPIPSCPFRFHENQKMERGAQYIQKASRTTNKQITGMYSGSGSIADVADYH